MRVAQNIVHVALAFTIYPVARVSETNTPRQNPRTHGGILNPRTGCVVYAQAKPTTRPIRKRLVIIVHMRAVHQIPGVELEANAVQITPATIPSGSAMRKRFLRGERVIEKRLRSMGNYIRSVSERK